MRSETTLNINLLQASRSDQPIHYELGDDFFESLDQSEIAGGKVFVNLQIKESANGFYTATLDIKGQVVVECDRCLDPLTIEVSNHDRINIKDGKPEESDPVDTLYADPTEQDIDLSWIVYELVETALPIQRTHPIGQCNPEVTRFILNEEDSSEEGAANDQE